MVPIEEVPLPSGGTVDRENDAHIPQGQSNQPCGIIDAQLCTLGIDFGGRSIVFTGLAWNSSTALDAELLLNVDHLEIGSVANLFPVDHTALSIEGDLTLSAVTDVLQLFDEETADVLLSMLKFRQQG